MRSRVLTTSSIALIALILIVAASRVSTKTGSQTAPGARPVVTKAQIDKWMKDLSNWGRWGKDDQLGTMNLISDAKRKQAVALSSSDLVMSEHLPAPIREQGAAPLTVPGSRMTLEEVKRWYARKVLEDAGGNKMRAAEILGVDRGTLYRLLRRHRDPSERP